MVVKRPWVGAPSWAHTHHQPRLRALKKVLLTKPVNDLSAPVTVIPALWPNEAETAWANKLKDHRQIGK